MPSEALGIPLAEAPQRGALREKRLDEDQAELRALDCSLVQLLLEAEAIAWGKALVQVFLQCRPASVRRVDLSSVAKLELCVELWLARRQERRPGYPKMMLRLVGR